MVRQTPCEVPYQTPWRGAAKHESRARMVRFAAALLAILLLLQAADWSSNLIERQLDTDDQQPELIYLPPTRFLKAIALGYEQALANILWFRTISYFGRHYQSNRIYPWLASMCDTVTDLDPHAEHVYRFCGVILPWEADRIDDGVALLEKGVRNMPDSWQLQYMLGFSYYFFHGDLVAASRTLRTATFAPGAPEYVSRLASIVNAAQYGPSTAVEFLAQLERDDTTGEMREAIRQRIRELSLSADIDSLEAAVQTFSGRMGRRPIDLEELVVVGILPQLPEEQFGGRYVLDPVSGHVVSTSGHKPMRLGSSPLREAFLKARRSGN